MADSLYEYIPKEYLMLGGNSAQYRSMYEKFADAAKKHLFFRPMIPSTNRDILISGTVRKLVNGDFKLDPEGQHLTCFMGGVLAIGSKIFKRPNDLTVSKKLVDGCIWAYETAPNGIMPELFRTWPCPDPENCVWDEKEWYTGVVHHGATMDSSIKPKNNDEMAQIIIERMKLPKGFTDVRDTRYILR
jgi:mannosyl-oligosaccharide alpha-1,2-mannosidase